MLLLTVSRIVFNACNFKLSDYQLELVYTTVVEICIMGILPLVLYTLMQKQGNIVNKMTATYKDFGFNFKLPVSVYLLTVVLAILIYHLTIASSTFFNIILVGIDFRRVVYAPTIYENIGDVLLAVFFTAVVPAVCEELTHRGMLLNGLRKYGDRTAVFVSALLFGLMHQNILQVFYAFIAGLILGTLRIKSGSIIMPMLVHFGNNCLSVLIEYSLQHDGILYNFYYSIYGSTEFLGVLILFVSWIATYYVFKMIMNYFGQRTGVYRSKRLLNFAREKLVIMYEPMLSASVVPGFLTTIIILIWSYMR